MTQTRNGHNPGTARNDPEDVQALLLSIKIHKSIIREQEQRISEIERAQKTQDDEITNLRQQLQASKKKEHCLQAQLDDAVEKQMKGK